MFYLLWLQLLHLLFIKYLFINKQEEEAHNFKIINLYQPGNNFFLINFQQLFIYAFKK